MSDNEHELFENLTPEKNSYPERKVLNQKYRISLNGFMP